MSHNPNCKHPGPHGELCSCAILEMAALREESGKRRKAVLDLLDTIEWAGSAGAAEDPCCPACGGFAPVDFVSREPKGHTEHCKLAQVRKMLEA